FILRLYRVRPNFKKDTVQVRDAISLSDPDGKVPFPIVNENTEDRILTGGDFDIESVRQANDGTTTRSCSAARRTLASSNGFEAMALSPDVTIRSTAASTSSTSANAATPASHSRAAPATSAWQSVQVPVPDGGGG